MTFQIIFCAADAMDKSLKSANMSKCPSHRPFHSVSTKTKSNLFVLKWAGNFELLRQENEVRLGYKPVCEFLSIPLFDKIRVGHTGSERGISYDQSLSHSPG